MAWLAMVASVAGSAVSAYGQHQAGDMEHDAARYNAIVKEREA